jgi:hypothetical protein
MILSSEVKFIEMMRQFNLIQCYKISDIFGIPEDMPANIVLDEEGNEYMAGDENISLPNARIDDSPLTTEAEMYKRGIISIAGIIAFRLGAKFDGLLGDLPVANVPSFVQHFAKRGISCPSQTFYDKCVAMDRLFFEIHDEGVNLQSGVMKKFQILVDKSILKVDQKISKLFGWLRLCIRIRCLNNIPYKDREKVLQMAEEAKRDKSSRAFKTRQIWMAM